MVTLTYGNTNTFFLNGLLVDTDYAGTLYHFYKEIKKHGITLNDIRYVLATHYHPDHVGLIGELQTQGVTLVLIDKQMDAVHFSDRIFERDRAPFTPIREEPATTISCESSRSFLDQIGISGEILHTPSHSADSIALVCDDGDCFVGDLAPFAHLDAYDGNALLQRDWSRIFSLHPKRIFYAHRPMQTVSCEKGWDRHADNTEKQISRKYEAASGA